MWILATVDQYLSYDAVDLTFSWARAFQTTLRHGLDPTHIHEE